ncbi:MAG: hypothetical protein EPO21_18190 [Chloroflexota bacterium]|nr:MAG: hypothetical protein EPO21_18190 [Chloroflexota bacterium]
MSLATQPPAEATRRTIWQTLENSVKLHGGRDAIVYRGVHVTYADMFQQVERLAAGMLSAGIKPGDHVAIIFPTTPEWVYVHYALTTMGVTVVPINFMYKADEVRWVLSRADVSAIITLDSFLTLDFLGLLRSVDPALVPGEVNSEQLPLIKRVFVLSSGEEAGGPYSLRTLLAHETTEAERAQLATIRTGQTPDDPCYIVFTSGSTARPKSALIPQRAVTGAGHYFARGLDITEEDRFLAMLPTFHTGGFVCCITLPHSSGAASYLLGAFEPGLAMETIERERCTATGGFDTMYTKIMGHPDFERRDLSSLKKTFVGCTPAYYDQLQSVFNFRVAATLYGCTEGAALAAITMPDETDPEIRRNSNGRPLPGLEFRVIDPETGRPVPAGTPGEICFRGWNRFLEYYKMPEETAEAVDADGFVHMGDYGWLDEQGNLYYRGRYKMMIKTGGENVSQREVEIFLEDTVPAVEFAQVVGVPDDVWNEAVVAFVQLRSGSNVTPEDIRAQCRDKIAGFKIPKHVFLMTARDWPLLDVGRPDKHTLRRMALERLGRKE